MCLFFSARHINDLKHLYLLILLCLFWEHAEAEQSFQLNDFISTPWFLINGDEPSADKNTRPDALHIFHRNSLTNSELTRKVDLLVNPAIDSLAASGVSPASILALLYKPDAQAGGHTYHEVAVCVSSAPVVKKGVWAVSDNLPYPLDCEPLTAADNRHACKVRLDLNREHQVLAISGARFDSDCTQQLLLKTFRESPITKMAAVHYSRRTEQQAPSDQDNKKIQQELTGQFNPAGLPFPPGEKREKRILSGGGGWDDFHDQGKRHPPQIFMQHPKLQVILPGVPLPSLFYDADASEDQNQESPAGWSVDSQQNRVRVHFEMNGALHRLELELNDWELLVQHGIARSPNLLCRVMVNMLRYQGQQKQLLKELDNSLAQYNEQSASLVAGIFDDLTALPPDHLLLATSLADLLVPAYESHLRQEAGWALQKEHTATTQWFYFNTLKTLAGLLFQRSVAEQTLNTLQSDEGRRLILMPVGALLPDQMASLLRDQISYIAHNIITYIKASSRQAAGGQGTSHQGSGNPPDLPTTSSQQGATEGSGNGGQAPGGGQGGGRGDDKRKDEDKDSGQNRELVANPLVCSECQRELTPEDVKRLSRNQGFDKPLCRTCENKDLPVKNEQLQKVAVNTDAGAVTEKSGNTQESRKGGRSDSSDTALPPEKVAKIESSTFGENSATDATETNKRRPRLNFENVEEIGYIWVQKIMPRSQVRYQGNIRDEYRDKTDITLDALSYLIGYQQNQPQGFIMGDAVTFGPLTASEFDQLCNFLEKDLSLTPDNTTIVDAGSGSHCYHSALFALAGFVVRPYDNTLTRSGYDKSLSPLGRAITPFLKPNDKDLTGDDITPDFFDESSILFMSFPDTGYNPMSPSLVKKYTESAALNKVIILLIHSYDEGGNDSVSVSKETSKFLKENYELRKTIHTDRFEDQPTQVQIHVRKALE